MVPDRPGDSLGRTSAVDRGVATATPHGRVTVSFVPGESPIPRAWADREVGEVGDLLRRLHEATASFSPPADARWKPTWLRDLQQLWLRVFEGNGRARRFYERLGWTPTGQESRSAFAPHPVLVEYVFDRSEQGAAG